MRNFLIQTGLVITRWGEIFEYASQAGVELYFEQPETGRRETILLPSFWDELQNGTISIVQAFSSPKQLLLGPETPEQQFKNLRDVSARYQEETQTRLKYIRKLREAGVTIGQKHRIGIELPRIALDIEAENRTSKFETKAVPSVSTVCRWWRAYQKGNFELYTVVSKNTRRTVAQKLDDESERFLQDSIESHYLTNTRPNVTQSYDHYSDAFAVENKERESNGSKKLTLVASRTFYSRINALPKFDVMESRLGKDAARHHFKMIKGHMPADYPLDAVEIDHTPLNLYVIDDMVYLPLGRPWLTAIKDRYSGILLGFYVSFQKTGLSSIFGALRHSLHSHHMAYQRWPDLVNPWPAHGRGILYVSDRGADFQSLKYRSVITSLGAQYELCQRHTPWLKGSIERFFLTLEQTFFEAMPGRTFSCLKERRDYDPVKQSVVRFSSLIYLLHKWASDYHNVQVHSRKKASPLDLWNEGIGMAPPPYPANVDELKVILGLRESGSLSHEGIRYQCLNFANEELGDLMKDIGRDKKVDFVVSPEDLSHIHVKHPVSGEYLKITCTRPDYASGLSLLQHQHLRAQTKAQLKEDKDSGRSVDLLMQTRIAMQTVIREEVEKKANVRKMQLAKVAGINSNATLQGKNRTISNPFQGQQVGSAPSTPSIEVPVTDTPRYSWGD